MTGPFAFSVTNLIDCVNIDDLIICEVPIFGISAEVEIANSVGFV